MVGHTFHPDCACALALLSAGSTGCQLRNNLFVISKPCAFVPSLTSFQYNPIARVILLQNQLVSDYVLCGEQRYLAIFGHLQNFLEWLQVEV